MKIPSIEEFEDLKKRIKALEDSKKPIFKKPEQPKPKKK